MQARACFRVLACGLGLVAAAAAPAVAAVTRLVVHDGRISGTVEGASTRSVLEELARCLGGRLTWQGGGAERPVSVALAAVPITEAVARVVPGRSFLLVEDARGAIREIRVFAGRDEVASGPVVPAPAASGSLRVLADVDRAARARDPAAAAAALEEIARGDDVLGVRMAALERLARLETGMEPLLAAADGLWGAELAPRAVALLAWFAGEDARVDRLLRRDGGPS